MGWLGRILGRPDATHATDPAASRCNECGMTAGRHTDWCPLAPADREEARAAEPRASSARGEDAPG